MDHRGRILSRAEMSLGHLRGTPKARQKPNQEEEGHVTIIYLAGPYRDGPAGNRRQNIRRAEEYAARLWACGFAVLCPHLNTAFFDGDAPAEAFLDGDLDIIRALARGADRFILALLPGWQLSKGTLAEKKLAEELGQTVADAGTLLEESINAIHQTR